MCLFLLCLRIVRFAPLFYTYRTPQSGFLLFFKFFICSIALLSFSLSSLRFFSHSIFFLFWLYLLFSFFLSFSLHSLCIFISLSLSLVLFVLTLFFSSISLSLNFLLSPSLYQYQFHNGRFALQSNLVVPK